MKRLWKLGLACMLFLLMLSACSYQYRPTEGVWYCEKLDIYLDMDSPNKGMYLAENGSYEPLVFLIDYGTGFYIEFRESEQTVMTPGTETIDTDFRYRNGILTLTDRESGEKYHFTEVDRALYPGG